MAVSVLIVEDDRNIAELLQMYLEKEGYAVTTAGDGGKGLQKFRAIKPDLVLLDVMMPVMDGWTVCRNIRAEATTPIIMLTAKGETDDKVTGLKAGGPWLPDCCRRCDAARPRFGQGPPASQRVW